MSPSDVREEEAPETAELFVDERIVEEFKNFKQEDWKYYLADWTWWRAEVVYDVGIFSEHSQLFRYLKYILIAYMVFYLMEKYTATSNYIRFSEFEK